MKKNILTLLNYLVVCAISVVLTYNITKNNIYNNNAVFSNEDFNAYDSIESCYMEEIREYLYNEGYPEYKGSYGLSSSELEDIAEKLTGDKFWAWRYIYSEYSIELDVLTYRYCY